MLKAFVASWLVCLVTSSGRLDDSFDRISDPSQVLKELEVDTQVMPTLLTAFTPHVLSLISSQILSDSNSILGVTFAGSFLANKLRHPGVILTRKELYMRIAYYIISAMFVRFADIPLATSALALLDIAAYHHTPAARERAEIELLISGIALRLQGIDIQLEHARGQIKRVACIDATEELCNRIGEELNDLSLAVREGIQDQRRIRNDVRVARAIETRFYYIGVVREAAAIYIVCVVGQAFNRK